MSGRGGLVWLSAALLALALFQCWYVSLPPEQAARFDVCRFSRRIDCYESLGKHGAGLETWGGLPVFPALAGLFFCMTLCAALGVLAEGGDRAAAWRGWAKLLSFPASGLAVYVLLADYFVAKATSLSALLVCAGSLGVNALALLGRLEGVRLRRVGPGAAAALASAAVFGFCLHGGGSARREIEGVLREREMAPPSVRWPRFAEFVPRRDAAHLGEPGATKELLLFVDPTQEASRKTLAQLRRDRDAYLRSWIVYLYAPGEAGLRLLAARKQGLVDRFLETGELPPAPTPEGDPALYLEHERIQAAIRRLRIERYPLALTCTTRSTTLPPP